MLDDQVEERIRTAPGQRQLLGRLIAAAITLASVAILVALLT